MEGKNVIKNILISAAVGAIAGILFAPDKGSKTRKEISKKGKEYSDMARDEFDDFLDYTKKKYDEARKHTDDLFERGEARAQELKKKVKK